MLSVLFAEELSPCDTGKHGKTGADKQQTSGLRHRCRRESEKLTRSIFPADVDSRTGFRRIYVDARRIEEIWVARQQQPRGDIKTGCQREVPSGRAELIDCGLGYTIVNEKVITTSKPRNSRCGIRISEGEDGGGGVVVRSQPGRDRDDLGFVKVMTCNRRGLGSCVGDGVIIRAGHVRKTGRTARKRRNCCEFHP